jgi:DNA-binding CsgD family transcriptional regulator
MYAMTELIKVSPAERTILRELMQYDRNQDIADALCLSVHTVKAHLSHLFEKFDVSSRHRLLANAFCWGFITSDGEVFGGN